MRWARKQRGPQPLSFVFVMTYGRSGSTLLQAILNSAPGVLIRGENRGITRLLHEYHATALREAERVGEHARRRVNPWFGMYDYPADTAIERLRGLVVDTLLRPDPGTRVTGFKEIRWYGDDLAGHVSFLRELFPGARFIANTRRLEDVARSGWWPEREEPLRELRAIEDAILEVAEGLGPDAFRVRYDDYVAAPERLVELFDWLGEPFDLARVEQVIRARRYARL